MGNPNLKKISWRNVIWRKYDFLPVPHDVMISIVGSRVKVDGQSGCVENYLVGGYGGSGTITMIMDDKTTMRFNRDYINTIEPLK